MLYLRPSRQCVQRTRGIATFGALCATLLALCLSAGCAVAQNVPVRIPGPGEPPISEEALSPAHETPSSTWAPSSQPTLQPSVPPTVVLILPSDQTPYVKAAEAVRAGLMAAHQAMGMKVVIKELPIDERPESLNAALAQARDLRAAAIVGPLTRTQVNHAVETGRAGAAPAIPMLALNYPDWQGSLPPNMLAFGLAIEHEAKQLVGSVLADLDAAGEATTALKPRFLVIGGQGSLSKRAAAAFAQALKEGGERATVVTPTLDRIGLDVLAEEVARGGYVAAFLALDAKEAMVVRARLPASLALFATSQVNVGGKHALLTANELEGVRFADMPWLLEPDHAAVMVYTKPQEAWSPELQRLYALGIDAYRLSLLWMAGQTQFELDGVTGTLRVGHHSPSTVERIPAIGIFRKGLVLRHNPARPMPAVSGSAPPPAPDLPPRLPR